MVEIHSDLGEPRDGVPSSIPDMGALGPHFEDTALHHSASGQLTRGKQTMKLCAKFSVFVGPTLQAKNGLYIFKWLKEKSKEYYFGM